ncbi:hypothetical protein BCF50_1846 [Chryseobacterium daecheongense]|uniref:Uncharacterized protein n=1 Tax=Chryseobacterium daecheongense TaxID=192389 RepID=A0ABY2FVB7_9FLAO|nr:hypothetical protein BCF50_1846 [Chryseobacterium daecheongense]
MFCIRNKVYDLKHQWTMGFITFNYNSLLLNCTVTMVSSIL